MAAAIARLSLKRTRPSAVAAWATKAVGVRYASISGSDIRAGDLLEIDNGLWRVNSANVSRTAMGRAFMQCELRHLTENTKKDVRYRSDDTVERADLDTPKKVQILYSDGTAVHVMDQATYEQSEIPLALLGDKAAYVQDGMFLHLESFKGVPAVINFPLKVTLDVAELEDIGISTCSAVLANGMKVRVPKHLKAGDKVVIDTRTGEYAGKE